MVFCYFRILEKWRMAVLGKLRQGARENIGREKKGKPNQGTEYSK